MIPKADLIKFCEDRLEAVRRRPLQYGGTWAGVEMIIMDMLEMREWARAHPADPNADPNTEWVRRWHSACAKAYRGGNTFLAHRLEQDSVVDAVAIQKVYNDALDNYELDGMTSMDVLSKAHADEDTYQLLSRGTP